MLASCHVLTAQDGVRPLHIQRTDNLLGASLPSAIVVLLDQSTIVVGSRNLVCDFVSRSFTEERGLFAFRHASHAVGRF